MTHTSAPVRTRMAPSPTGDMHVGSMAVLLKNYAFAKRHGGQFIIRIEDTDQEREVEGATQGILDIVKKYGLDWAEGPDKGGPYGPYTQSDRLEIYQEHAQQLLKDGKAYYCFCTRERLEQVRAEQMANKKPPRYDQHCRNLSKEEVDKKLAENTPYVIRLRVPDAEDITFTDLLRGDITINSHEVDDQVLMKSDGFPTYHLAVVVDDHLMKISHILRGEEWISSTPKHVLLYRAFGWEQPIYAHIPVFLNPDGKGKMSKRKGTVSAQSFLDAGYLPQAMLNFFMILGWSPKDQREIMTLDEYVNEFDPKDMSAKSVVFDLKKLEWMNGMYIRQMSVEQLAKEVTPFLPSDFPKQSLTEILPLIQERLLRLTEVEQLTHFFYRDISIDKNLLVKKSTAEEVKAQLTETLQKLESLNEWDLTSLEEAIRTLQDEHQWKKNQYFMMLRVVVTGETATPPLFETIQVIGKDKVIGRIQQAIESL